MKLHFFKTILLVLTFFSAVSSFAQTEEETLIWFRDYGNGMGSMYSDKESNQLRVSEDGVKIYFSRQNSWGTKRYTVNVDYADLKYMYIEPFCGNTNSIPFEFSKQVVYFTECDEHSSDFCNRREYYFMLDFKDVKNIQRTVKAINHLAKLQGEKPKLKVKEDTF